MIEFGTLKDLSKEDVDRLVTGYLSDEIFVPTRTESADRIEIVLERTKREVPYKKESWGYYEEAFEQLRGYLKEGLSIGAWEDGRLVGIVVGEKRTFDGSLWVWEFVVDPAVRRRGVASRLMDELAQREKEQNCRVLFCECQNTNASVIDFYRNVGFSLNGLDLTLYQHSPDCEEEIALFMKRHIGTPSAKG